MKTGWKRREFVRAVSYGLAGWTLAPGALLGAARTDGLAGLIHRAARTGGLPPRTIGARTRGGDFRFDPAGLLVELGDEVVWLNMGDFHTATAFHPANAHLLAVDVPLRIPAGAEPWHSGMLGLTATEFRHRFTVPGVYDYFCQPHYSFGMVGRIVVGEADSAGRPLDELNEASRAQMLEVSSIVGPAGRIYEWAARLNGVLLLAANDLDAQPAAGAVAAGVVRDEALGRLLDGAGLGDAFARALSRFVEAVKGGVDYEALVARADEVKAVLASARAGTS